MNHDFSADDHNIQHVLNGYQVSTIFLRNTNIVRRVVCDRPCGDGILVVHDKVLQMPD
ncbi:MAG: hypothetical protein JWQ63_836 [Mucilaginibacter sp.]|nr:hypothetical protein [Mucilaginibacter sp.]